MGKIRSVFYNKIMFVIFGILLFTTFVNSQDSNCTLVGRWANGRCYGIAARNDTAYIGNGASLEIVNLLVWQLIVEHLLLPLLN